MGILQEQQLQKIQNTKKLTQLKQDFLELGITFPKDELLLAMPRKSVRDGIVWFDGARNYWNHRNTHHDEYYKCFKKALDNTKQKLNKQ
jgi:hypothetical protein